MPELPEVEITARLLDRALRGAQVESALAPGINALKTFDPPLSALEGERILAVRRRGKHLIVDFSGELVLLIHLMSAGRLQLFDKRAGPRDRTSRLLVRVLTEDGERELRLREFGSKQAAWVKLLRAGELEQDESLSKLGPEAWPEPPALRSCSTRRARCTRCCATSARSRASAARGSMRSCGRRSCRPTSAAPTSTARRPSGCARRSSLTLGAAIAHYEQSITLPIPDKLPMPLRVHRHEGEPCPRCAETLRAVHFEDYVIAYCPDLPDRRAGAQGPKALAPLR
jgi:formamidopyrimidine-DNA glycosylase